MKKILVLLIFFVFGANETILSQESPKTDPSPFLSGTRDEERTSYQQAGGYDPRFDLRSDIVMVYGISDSDIEGLKLWKEKSGSKMSLMTGIAWGQYQDYLNGDFDGIDHWEDAQVQADEQQMLHNPTIPYMVPSIAFCEYLESRLKKVIDAGIDTLYLEEPEFWAFTGFSKSFQREWQIYYRENWIRPDSNADAQYRSAKLKQYLYRRLIDRLCSSLKEYSLQKYQRPLSIYIATHSLISYAQIQMISPESSLLDLPGVDGLIAQIWTGTSRHPNVYQGKFAERTFESAFLEYNVMQEMVRGTGKRVYYLNDPVEDNLNYDWNDYQRNYYGTLIASLMQSETFYYEICPWPSRVFLGKYPAGSPDATSIPEKYASTLSLTFQQLRDMKQDDVHWDQATEGIGVLLSDSAMFQRAEPTVRDGAVNDENDSTRATQLDLSAMSGFYGLTIPLIKHGIPIDVPVLDHVLRYPGYLEKFKVLVLSYEFQKPLHPGIHAALADWVSRGGILIYVGAETDIYHQVRDFWNSGNSDFKSPGEHLFNLLGMPRNAESGQYSFGKGFVLVERRHPAQFSRSIEKANEYRNLIALAMDHKNEKLIEKNYFLKHRGPYIVAAVLTESISDDPLVLNGRFVNLLDSELKFVKEISVKPSEKVWLLDLDKISQTTPLMLASAGRIETWNPTEKSLDYSLSATKDIELISLLKLPSKPEKVIIDGQSFDEYRWDSEAQTLFLKHRSSGTANVSIQYQ
ncbi:MAG: hypothetical protein Q4C95_03545 [Planctomycetia bacterium]|nr:hypothetical protein [Planctomycetia bacterium]